MALDYALIHAPNCFEAGLSGLEDATRSAPEESMAVPIRIGIMGDFEPAYHSHFATNAALYDAATKLKVPLEIRWLPTPSLEGPAAEKILQRWDGLYCNYGVNEDYEKQFQAAGLRVSARGIQGETRAVELPGHRFFIATLFQPQLSSRPEAPHRFLIAFLRAAMRFRKIRTRKSRPARR